MKKRIFIFFMLALWCFLLSVRLTPHKSLRPFAVGMDICIRHGENTRLYAVSEEKEMGMILSYLRVADSRIIPEHIDNESKRNHYTIRVRLANGKCHIYQQLGEDFFSKDGGPWTQIPAGRGKKLKILEKKLFPNKVFT